MTTWKCAKLLGGRLDDNLEMCKKVRRALG